MSAAAALSALALYGCAGSVTWIAPSKLEAAKLKKPLVDLGDFAAVPQQQATLDEAIEATWQVVSSELFAQNLATIASLQSETCGAQVSGVNVLAQLQNEVLCVKYSPSRRADETAHTGISHDQGCAATLAPFAETAFGVQHLDRWNAIGTEAHRTASRACVINTIAHEWTHAILDDSKRESRFKDAGHLFSTDVLVSYTVGAVAQCTYLEGPGKAIIHERFRSCVEYVGINRFAADVCDSKWYERLKSTPSTEARK